MGRLSEDWGGLTCQWKGKLLAVHTLQTSPGRPGAQSPGPRAGLGCVLFKTEPHIHVPMEARQRETQTTREGRQFEPSPPPPPPMIPIP